MSEIDNAPDAAVNVDAMQVTPGAEKKSFLSTSSGKVVVIAVALGALAIIAGVVLALVLFVFGKDAVDDFQVTITPTETPAAESTETVEAAEPADAVPNADVFTFRDIFEPLILPPVESTTTTDTSTTTTDTANTTTPGTLYLTNIVVENNEYVAVLSLDGVTYTLGDGERVGDTPWQVVSVRQDSVVMLYGDTQVVLTIGQGVTK